MPELAGVFTDHAVLQREMVVPIWGQATPGDAVTVKFNEQSKSTVADSSGNWRVELDPMPASAKGQTLEVSSPEGNDTIQHVVIGEVWLCAGQSNMARRLRSDARDYPRFREYAKDSDYPEIRFFSCPVAASNVPQPDLDPLVQADAGWISLNPETAKKAMSIPFFFAKRIHQELEVPVGLVQIAVSGTPLTAWMAKESLEKTAAATPGLEGYTELFAKAEKLLAREKLSYSDWEGFERAEEQWRQNPEGKWPGANVRIPDFPSVLYNTRVHPLAPLAFRGVLWHQGEGGPEKQYRKRLLAMISQWRQLFGHDFYFIWGSLTRLASFSPPLTPTLRSKRGNMHEQFLLAAQDAEPEGRSLLINFVDLGNAHVHWARKAEAGKRMAQAALTNIYDKSQGDFTGPELTEASFEGENVVIYFRHAEGGLVYQPSLDGISGFILEGQAPDSVLRWANVAVDGQSVSLSHPDITAPANAYYGWANNGHETLFNQAGLPAYPFRARPQSGRPPVATEAPPLVELVDAPKSVTLDINHVRRNGYIFSVQQKKGKGQEVAVRARLPREWSDVTVKVGGNPVEARVLQGDGDDHRLVEFAINTKGTRVEILRQDSPPDFSNIDRF